MGKFLFIKEETWKRMQELKIIKLRCPMDSVVNELLDFYIKNNGTKKASK